MIEFGAPLLLVIGTIVFAAMVAGAVWLTRWRRRARARFAGPQATRWPASTTGWQTGLLLTAAALVVLAAARPQWGTREFSREQQGIDLIILLDISQSMQVKDASPTRLGLAQDEIVRLLEATRGNRVGMVFFAGSAIARSPLSTDTQSLIQLVRRADREGGLTRVGSDIGGALEEAKLLLEGSESPGKAVLLVSDGEDHVAQFAAEAQALRDEGVVIFTAGVGTAAGGQIIDTDRVTGNQRPRVDASGRPVISRLVEPTLQSVAQAGGGRYVHLVDRGDLLSVRDDLAHLEQTPFGQEARKVPIERFQWFIGGALVLLALSWLVPARMPSLALRKRLRPAPGLAVALLALMIGACGGGESLRERNAEANRLFDAGDYAAALAAYEELLAERPDVPQLAFNAGNTLHRLGEYERAVTETQRALPPDDTRLGAQTYYALGNHLFALKRFEEAYDAYRSALLLDPGDGDAKFNLELTLLILNGDVDPQAGEGEGEPMDPGDQGAPGQEPPAQPPPPTSPPSGQPPPTDTPPTPAEVRRALEEALRGIDDEVTFEEAIRILDLLRQQQERQRPATTQPNLPTGPDY